MTGVSLLHNVEEIRSERVVGERKRGTIFSSSSIRMVVGIQSVRTTFVSEKVMSQTILLHASEAELAYFLSFFLSLSYYDCLSTGSFVRCSWNYSTKRPIQVNEIFALDIDV